MRRFREPTYLPQFSTMDDFSNYCLPNPSLDEVTAEYIALEQELDIALARPDTSDDALRAVVGKWDRVRRRLESWSNLVEIRFNQETHDPDFKAAQDYRDEIAPKLTELNVRIQKKLVETPLRPRLEEIFGAHAFKLWEVQNSTFDPCIHDDLVLESKLVSRYNELTAAAKVEFQGEEFNLSSISKFEEHADRDVRYGAARAMWQWFFDNRAELDQIYGELVTLRHGIAQKLGYDSFVELAYRRMSRTDYGSDDVARYREEVREHVVPLCREIHRTQEDTLNLEDLMFWDEGLFDSDGNPTPQGSYEKQIELAQQMFNDMNVDLGKFFQVMCDKNLLDLKIRPWKAGGGFCSSLPSEELPFIFANFNGSKGDVEVFTHEMGHAFQCYSSFDGAALLEHVWPTYEACEIHSMSLEFLTWPHMEMFFGDAAERFRRIHLLTSLLFLPYGVAVDHFQHAIFAEPDATPERRHAIWQEMERLYLPDTNYGDLPHVSTGGRWQQKRHIYMSPFYYIDYTLAQCCALQFWVRSQRDFATAMQDYVELCKRGGTMPFSGLVDSAGLKNPFKPGSLKEVVQQAREYLKL